MTSNLIDKPVDDHGMLGLHPSGQPARQELGLSDGFYARYLKRAMDIISSLFLIAIGLPLIAVIWLYLAFQSGPVFFAHSRIGRHGKTFPCLKFRTMLPDADQRLKALLETDPVVRQQWDDNRKLSNDPRITRMGQFLRRSSLDELPQLFNVLRGDMSLVGPRPVTAPELARYGTDQSYYLALTPGITGLWQVSGRNQISYAARVALDRHYAETFSFWQDLSILLRTVGVVIRANGK